MRKLKLQVQMTVDGYIAGPNGEMDWVTFDWDDELKNYVTALTEPVDCIVLGRKLAQGFIPHWAARPAGEDPWSIDKFIYTHKVVFTRTLVRSEWEHTVLAKGDLLDEIMQLKNQSGQDIIAYGGGTFVSSLINARLIDELHLFVNPAALGAGMSIFTGPESRQNLALKHSQAFACGIVVLCYTPRPD